MLQRSALKFGDLIPALAWGVGVFAFILYDYRLFQELHNFIINLLFFIIIEAHFIYRGLEHPVIWRNGISSPGGLWYWSEIESYHWAEERTPLNEDILILDTRKKIIFFRWEVREKWVIPPHLHSEIEMILQGHPNSLLRRAALQDFPDKEPLSERMAEGFNKFWTRFKRDSKTEPWPGEPVLTEPEPAESSSAEPGTVELGLAGTVPAEPEPAEPELDEAVPAESELAGTVPAGFRPYINSEPELPAQQAPGQEVLVQQAAAQETLAGQEAGEKLVPLNMEREMSDPDSRPRRVPLKASGILTSAILMIIVGLAPVLFAYMQWLNGGVIRPAVIFILSMFFTSALGGAVSMRISNVRWPEPVPASLLAAVVLSVYAVFVFQWYSNISYLDSLSPAIYLLIGSAGIFILTLVDPVVRSSSPMPAIWKVGLATLIFLGLTVLYSYLKNSGWFGELQFELSFMKTTTLFLAAMLGLALASSLIRKDKFAAWTGSLGVLTWLLGVLVWLFTGHIDLV